MIFCIFRQFHEKIEEFWSKFINKNCLADHLLELQCSLTTSNRGNPILWDMFQNSYYRIQTHESKSKSLWKCRHPGCKARVHTNDVACVIIRRRNPHCHEQNATKPIECSVKLTENISVSTKLSTKPLPLPKSKWETMKYLWLDWRSYFICQKTLNKSYNGTCSALNSVRNF